MEADGADEVELVALLLGRGVLADRTPVNNMLKCWDTLISANRCPFVKVSLIFKNPPEGIDRLPSLLRQSTPCDPKLIEDHVRRIKE